MVDHDEGEREREREAYVRSDPGVGQGKQEKTSIQREDRTEPY